MRSCAWCWPNSSIAHTACSPVIPIIEIEDRQPIMQTVSAFPVVRLASASPRRRELLTQIGVPYSVKAAHIDESLLPGEAPRDYVMRLAREKAASVWQEAAKLPVIAADTSVVLDDEIYGKPRDREHALSMLAALSNREHEV